MQVIINWQAFFVADGGHDPGQLNQGLVKKSSPSLQGFVDIHGFWTSSLQGAGPLTSQPEDIPNTWLLGEHSAESLVMGQSGWHFVVMGQLIALIALQ